MFVWLFFFLLPLLSLSLVCLPGFRGVKLLVRCVTVTFRLAVRLWVVGCPPAVSRPKVGGLGWLVVRSCGLDYSVDLLFLWLFALGGLAMQSIYVLLVVFVVQLAALQLRCSQRADLSACFLSGLACAVN